jgi:membrane protease YdiL (CAAX protease family)
VSEAPAESSTLAPGALETPTGATVEPPPARPFPKSVAILEVVAVSGVPTQAAITGALLLAQLPMMDGTRLSLMFFATLSLLDTLLVIWLIGRFLSRNREVPADVFLGHRPIAGEVLKGIALVPVVFVAVGALVLTIRSIAPWMHTVEHNPLEDFLSTPAHAAVFLVVVVIAGGVREELQRAFILHRFEQHLGGAAVGLAVFSVIFGLLHLTQGVDVAIAIGTLGLAWGLFYVRRRSAVLPMTNHASFNALQVVQVVVTRSLGW